MKTTPEVFSSSDQQLLMEGAELLKVKLSSSQCDQCLLFLSELHTWNKAFNLTAIRDPREMIVRHVLDSLAASSYLQGDRILDVGTGAGLPGIPLSIVRPECDFYLLDSNQKKQIFVSQVIKLLKLSNAEGVHTTVEAYQVQPKFSTIITRAFAPLADMINATQHLLADNGIFLAMMGKSPEVSALSPGYQMEALVPLKIPFGVGERHIALIKKSRL